MEGISKIVAIKASMNIGLSDEIKSAFPVIIPAQRPKLLNCQIKDPAPSQFVLSAEPN
jgi:hypothetical protein